MFAAGSSAAEAWLVMATERLRSRIRSRLALAATKRS